MLRWLKGLKQEPEGQALQGSTGRTTTGIAASSGTTLIFSPALQETQTCREDSLLFPRSLKASGGCNQSIT